MKCLLQRHYEFFHLSFFVRYYLICEKRRFEITTAKACADNTKADLKEIGWECEDRLHLAGLFPQSNGRRIQFFRYGAMLFGNF